MGDDNKQIAEQGALEDAPHPPMQHPQTDHPDGRMMTPTSIVRGAQRPKSGPFQFNVSVEISKARRVFVPRRPMFPRCPSCPENTTSDL